MSDRENLRMVLDKIQTRSIRVSFSARRSVKVGDDYRTAESSIEMEMEHEGRTITREEAYIAALDVMPMLTKKVYFDLAVAGVMNEETAKVLIARSKDYYGKAMGNGTDGGQNQSAVSGTGVADSSTSEGSTAGTVVYQGEDSRVPSEAGSSGGSPTGSEKIASSGPDPGP